MEHVKPEIVDDTEGDDRTDADDTSTETSQTLESDTPAALARKPQEESEADAITEPGKLMRIASMARAMLAEARETPSIDEAGRDHLRQIYERTVDELASVLPDSLREELASMFVPLDDDEIPTESELRLAQAQMVGWLEGLFNGIHAAVMTQQMAAQAQLARMQQQAAREETFTTGQYL